MSISLVYTLLLTLGGLLTIGGAWLQYFKEDESRKKADSLAQENKSLLKNIAETSQNSQLKIIDVTDKLNSAQNTIDILRAENLENVLGSGDSYLEMALKGSQLIATIHNPSNTPMYDLTLTIVQYEMLVNCRITRKDELFQIDNACYKNTIHNSNFPVIYGHSNVYTTYTPPKQRMRLRAIFHSRKRSYFQDLIYIPGMGEVSRIYNFENGKILNKKIINNNNMKVEWDVEFTYPPVMDLI